MKRSPFSVGHAKNNKNNLPSKIEVSKLLFHIFPNLSLGLE